MEKLICGLKMNKNTEIYHEDKKDMVFNNIHHFQIKEASYIRESNNILSSITFQQGPVKENGLSGIFDEDLLSILICRLEHYQQSEYRCRETAVALTKLEEAFLWLNKRTIERTNRQVEGTSEK